MTAGAFRLQFTWLGTAVITLALGLMELLRLAPKGSSKVRDLT